MEGDKKIVKPGWFIDKESINIAVLINYHKLKLSVTPTKMTCHQFLSIFIIFISKFYLSEAIGRWRSALDKLIPDFSRTQSTGVTGRLICDDGPAANVLV